MIRGYNSTKMFLEALIFVAELQKWQAKLGVLLRWTPSAGHPQFKDALMRMIRRSKLAGVTLLVVCSLAISRAEEPAADKLVFLWTSTDGKVIEAEFLRWDITFRPGQERDNCSGPRFLDHLIS
jgi:hypothetical protein